MAPNGNRMQNNEKVQKVQETGISWTQYHKRKLRLRQVRSNREHHKKRPLQATGCQTLTSHFQTYKVLPYSIL